MSMRAMPIHVFTACQALSEGVDVTVDRHHPASPTAWDVLGMPMRQGQRVQHLGDGSWELVLRRISSMLPTVEPRPLGTPFLWFEIGLIVSMQAQAC